MAFLHGVEVKEVDVGARPIATASTSVIGLVGTAERGPMNTPTLIAGSLKEAQDTFGLARRGYTIPDALEGILEQTGAVIVVIRVPETKSAGTEGNGVAFDADGFIDIGEHYVTDVLVKSSDDAITYVEKDIENDISGDYMVNGAAGKIKVVPGGAIDLAIQADPTVTFNYTYMTTDSTDFIVADDDEAGISALLGAESVVGATPRILIAPGKTPTDEGDGTFGTGQAVANALHVAAQRLRGIAVIDGPNTTDDAAKTYAGLFDAPRLYLVEPEVLAYDSSLEISYSQPASARVAGVIARSDNERGFWWSPSNRPINGIVGTSRPIDFALGDAAARANLLNEANVATIIRQNGYRLWGNRSLSSDIKWAFISVRRTADIINDSLLRAHLWAVDRNITQTYVSDVTEGVNNYLRFLKSLGAIIGGRAWPDPDLNTPDQIIQGKIYFNFDFTPPYPAEHITFSSILVNNYLEEIFA